MKTLHAVLLALAVVVAAGIYAAATRYAVVISGDDAVLFDRWTGRAWAIYHDGRELPLGARR